MDENKFSQIEKCARVNYSHMLDEIRGIIYCIQKTWELSNEEFCQLLGCTTDDVENILFGDIDKINIDIHMLARLNALSLNTFHLPGVKMSDETKQKVTEEIHAFWFEYHKPELSIEEMSKELLRNMGIHTDEDVKNAYLDMNKENGDWARRHKCLDRKDSKCNGNDCDNDDSVNCEAYVFDGKDTKKLNITPEQVGNFVDAVIKRILK